MSMLGSWRPRTMAIVAAAWIFVVAPGLIVANRANDEANAKRLVEMARARGATAVNVETVPTSWTDWVAQNWIFLLMPPAILNLLWRRARRRERG